MPLSSGFSVPTPTFPTKPQITTPQPPIVPVPSVPTESVEKPSLSAKDLALYVGVPVATLCVAGGLYYYYTKSKSGDGSNGEGDEETPVAVVAPMEKENALSVDSEKSVEVTKVQNEFCFY